MTDFVSSCQPPLLVAASFVENDSGAPTDSSTLGVG